MVRASRFKALGLAIGAMLVGALSSAPADANETFFPTPKIVVVETAYDEKDSYRVTFEKIPSGYRVSATCNGAAVGPPGDFPTKGHVVGADVGVYPCSHPSLELFVYVAPPSTVGQADRLEVWQMGYGRRGLGGLTRVDHLPVVVICDKADPCENP